jgi:protein Mpv17
MKPMQYLLPVAVVFSTSRQPIHALLQTDCSIRRSTHPLSSPPGFALDHAGKFKSFDIMRDKSSVSLQASLAEMSETDTHTENQYLPSPPPPKPETEELEMSVKVINFLFLAAAFGYAAYTIFNIENGMTRGWTTGEIAMRIPLDNWGTYESYLANKPIFTKTLINVIIYLLGDWLSQTVFQKKNVLDFDISRTLRNGFIGLCFGPLVHEYYQFSDSILPPENGLLTKVEKIFMDQTIYLSVKCSIYISAVGLLGGDDWPTVKQNVQDKIGGVMFTAWKFWPLVHCITYGLVPARHRILWVNSVDLVWNAILASKAQADVPGEDGEGEQLHQEEIAVMLEGSRAIKENSAHVADLKYEVLESEDAIVAEILPPSDIPEPKSNMTNMTNVLSLL